jgi:hypothetical protein
MLISYLNQTSTTMFMKGRPRPHRDGPRSCRAFCLRVTHRYVTSIAVRMDMKDVAQRAWRVPAGNKKTGAATCVAAPVLERLVGDRARRRRAISSGGC